MLRQPGADPAGVGAAGGGAGAAQETGSHLPGVGQPGWPAASYGNQALILQAWGRLEEALALHKKEEAICLELGNRDGLQRSYGNQALILKAWGRLEEALALHKKEEAICLELGNKDGLSQLRQPGADPAGVGAAGGGAGAAQEGRSHLPGVGQQGRAESSYGNQALILQAWGRLEEALALHKKEEAICLELGNKDGLQAQLRQPGADPEGVGAAGGGAGAAQEGRKRICLELGKKSGLGYCYWNWGLARAQGDRKTEKEKLEQALAIFTELKMPRERDAVQAELNKVGGE